MRADRLLSLLLLLQSRKSVKAKELARRLEVSPRTIYRDVDALSQAGVPVYAGATNAVLLRTALGDLRREHPGIAPLRLIPAAIERCYDGLVATLVNIVKAVGLASTIALPETVSAVNAILAEGADAGTMMNLLLVFYFLLVLAVLAGLRAARSAVRLLAWR